MDYQSNITIGCDPEFGFTVDGGVSVAASRIIERFDYVGTDHGGAVAEVRPPHDISPIGLTKNIKTALRDAYVMSPLAQHVKWLAGSKAGSQCIGGHIHFGTCNGSNDLRVLCNPEAKKVVEALDKIVAPVLLALEIPCDAVYRRSGEYGQLGAYRDQEWGLEYRPLPSWLVDPIITAGTLSMAYTVVNEYKDPKVIGSCAGLTSMTNVEFRRCDQVAAYRHAYNAMNFIEKLPLYKVFKKYMLPMFTLVANKKKWNPGIGMVKAWGLIKGEKQVFNKTYMLSTFRPASSRYTGVTEGSF